MSKTRSAPSALQQTPWQGRLYPVRVLFTAMFLVMLGVNDGVCGNHLGAHVWLVLAGVVYPHLAHFFLGRFEGSGRRGQAILVIDGLFAGAVMSSIGLVTAPSVVLATISLFNWMILGGPLLAAAGVAAALIGGALVDLQIHAPAIVGSCAPANSLAALVLLGYFLVVARIIYRHVGELRQQQADFQTATDVAIAASTVADKALLGVLPLSAAEILAEKGVLPQATIDNAALLLVEFAWSGGKSPDVADLADCFTICDAILTRHGLEGIKTFGRRYLAMSSATTGLDDAVTAVRELNNYLLDHRALIDAPRTQRSARAVLHAGTVTTGLVQPARLNFEVLGETAEALHSLAGHALAQPMATVVASAAAHRKLKNPAGFVATASDGAAPLYVLSLRHSP